MISIREIAPHITIGLLDLQAFARHNGILLKRTIEKQGTEFLLSKLLKNEPCRLVYNADNKPYLEGSPVHLSISHSHDRLALILNTKQSTGIDIELLRDKILRVRHKFLNEAERSYAGEDVELLITLWGAKEAMYKANGKKGVDFREHLYTEPLKGNSISGGLKQGQTHIRYTLATEKNEDYILVYILNEIREAGQ